MAVRKKKKKAPSASAGGRTPTELAHRESIAKATGYGGGGVSKTNKIVAKEYKKDYNPIGVSGRGVPPPYTPSSASAPKSVDTPRAPKSDPFRITPPGYDSAYAKQVRAAERTRKKLDKEFRKEEAEEFRTVELAKAAAEKLVEVEALIPEREEDGETPKLKPGVTPDEYNRELRRMRRRLKELKPAPKTSPGQVDITKLEIQNDFVRRTTQHRVETVGAPKTSRKDWQRTVKKINRRAKKIRTGQVDPPRQPEPLLAGLDDVARAAGKAVGQLKKVDEATGGRLSETAIAAIPGGQAAPFLDKALKATGYEGGAGGVLTGGIGKTLELAMRPSYAVQAEVAKGLVEIGAIKGKTAGKIRKAPGGAEVLLKGKTDGTVTGADLSQGIFGTEKAGLVFDVVLDPLMYVGVGSAKVAVRPAVKAAQLASRIEKAGIGYDASRLAEMGRRAAETGDFQRLADDLTEIAKREKVDVSGLGKTAADKQIRRETIGKVGAVRKVKARLGNTQARAEADAIKDAATGGAYSRVKRMLAEAKAAQGEGIKTSNPFLADVKTPTSHGIDAIRETAAWAARNNVRPGFEIRLLSPLGTRKGGLYVPVPAGFSTGMYKRALASGDSYSAKGRELFDQRQKDIEATVYREMAPKLAEAERGLAEATAKHLPNSPEVREAQERLDLVKSEIDDMIYRGQKHNEGPAGRGRPFGSATVGELTRLRNRRNFAHRVNQAATNFERDYHSQWMRAVHAAIKPLNKDPEALARVMLTMEERSGQGTAMLPPLKSDKEHEVMANLQHIFDRAREEGIRAGTLTRWLEDENYLPRQFTTDRGTLVTGKQATGDEMRRTGAGSGSAAKGRRAYETASIADKRVLARQIRHAWGEDEVSLERANELAEALFQSGRIRAATEITARQLQRGNILKLENAPELQRQLLRWDDAHAKAEEGGKRLFLDPANTEGFLMLSNHADEVYGITPDLYENLPAERAVAEKIHAAGEDLNRAARLYMETQDVDPKLAESWRLIMEQLSTEYHELQQLQQAMAKTRPSADGTPVVKLERTGDGTWEYGPYKVEAVPGRRYTPEELGHAERAARRRERKIAKRETVAERRRAAKARRRERLTPEPTPAVPDQFTHSPFNELRAALSGNAAEELAGPLKNWQMLTPADVRTIAGFLRRELNDPSSFLADRVFLAARGQAKQLQQQLARQLKPHVDVRPTPAPGPAPIAGGAKQPLESIGIPQQAPSQGFIVRFPAGEEFNVRTLDEASEKIRQEAIRTLTQAEEGLSVKPTYEFSQALKDTRDTDGLRAERNPLLLSDWYFRNAARAGGDMARYRAIDDHAGRDFSETQAQFSTRSGEHQGNMSELSQLWDPDDPSKLIGYKYRGSETVIPVDDLVVHERGLIRSGTDTWFDPTTGREYQPAHMFANIASNPVTGESATTARVIKDTFGDRLWPTDVARDMRAERMRMGDYDLMADGKGSILIKIMETLRYGVTVPFPAFHTRNMISDLLASVQADSGILFHPLMLAKVTALSMRRDARITGTASKKLWEKIPGFGTINVPGYGRMKNEDFLLLMDIFGARSNAMVSDLMLRANRTLDSGNLTLSFKHHPVARAKQFLNPFDRGGLLGLGRTGAAGQAVMEMSSRREDIMRMATILQRLRHNNGDMADAVWHMVATHFDYGDLTQAERKVVRNLFLFYTWYRKNIPRQLGLLVHRPGIFNAISFTYQNVADGTSPINQDWSKIHDRLPNMEGEVDAAGLIPDYMWGLSPLVSNWNGHTIAVGFGAPWADLTLINDTLNFWEDPQRAAGGFVKLATPLLQVPVTAATRQDMLTGRRFKQSESGGPAMLVDWIANKLGLGALPTNDDGDPVLPWGLSVILGSVPLAGRGSSYLDNLAPEDQDQGFMRSGLGEGVGRLLGGLTVYMSPEEGKPGKSPRWDLAWVKRLMARGYERMQFQRDLPDRDDEWKAEQLRKYDEKTAEWLKRIKAPMHYWNKIQNLGPEFYESAEEKASKSKLKQAVLSGTGGSTIGAPTKKKKDEKPRSMEDKALDKVQGKDKKDKSLPVLTSGFFGGGSSDDGPALGSIDDIIDSGKIDFDAAAEAVTEAWNEPAPSTPAPKNVKPRLTAEEKAAAAKEPLLKLSPSKATRKQKVKLASKILELRGRIASGAAASGAVPSGVPDRFKGLVAKYGPLVDEKAQEYGLTGTEFLAKMLKGESNFGQTEVGPDTPYGNARGPAQFIPGTRQDFIDKFGIDPWRSDEEAVKAMAYHLDGKHYGAGGIQGYNPGINDDYYLNQDVGELVQVKGGKKQTKKQKAKLAALMKKGKELGIWEVPDKQTVIKTHPGAGGKGAWSGVQYILDKAARDENVSSRKRAADHPLSISNPKSDHNEANTNAYAVDLPAVGEEGDRIAEKMHKRLQLKEPLEFGSYKDYTSDKYPGVKFQVLWQVKDHFDHVHVGGRADSPEGKLTVGPMSPMQQAKAMRAAKAAGDTAATGSGASTGGGGAPAGAPSTGRDAGGQFGLPSTVDSDGNVTTHFEEQQAAEFAPIKLNLGPDLLGPMARRAEQISEESKRRLRLLNL